MGPAAAALRACSARREFPYREIHSEHNPLFPGLNPEPIEPHVEGLRRAVMEGNFDAGFATDGDADRIGAIDRTRRLHRFAQDFLHSSQAPGGRPGVARGSGEDLFHHADD